MTLPVRRSAMVLSALAFLLAVAITGPTTPHAGAASGAIRLLEVSDWNGPTSVFRARLQLLDLPTDARLTFTLHSAVSGRDALRSALDGDRLGGTLLAGQLDRSGDTAGFEIPIVPQWPAPPGGAVLTSSGVHPIVIRALSPSGDELARIVTELIRLPAPTTTTPPLAVAMVVDLQQPQSTALDGSTYLAPEGQRALASTIDAIDAAPSVPLTLRPSAMTLSEFASAVEDAPATLARLRSSPTRQVISSSWAPIATGSWLDAGLEPEAREQLAAGRAALAGSTPTTPDATVAVIDPTIDLAALTLLHTTGVARIVVPSDQLPPISTMGTDALTRRFEVRDADGALLQAIAGDQHVTLDLTGSSDPIMAAHGALADLALLRLESESSARGIAVSIPGSAPAATVTALLHALEGRDGAASGAPGAALLSAVTLDDLFTITDAATTTGTAVPVVRSYTSDDPSTLGAYPAELHLAQREIAGLSSLVPENPSLVGPARTRALASGDRGLDPDRRGAAVNSVNGAVSAVTNEIVMSPQQIVTLTSHSGKVPLSIENRLAVPAHVHVSLTSAKLDFPEGAEFDQVLAPATTTRVDVQVTTRASGAFPLDVAITSADGSVAVTHARFTVRSTAISGVGLVISLGAGLFLLVWWARHFRTTRRASRLVGAAEATGGSSAARSPAATTDDDGEAE